MTNRIIKFRVWDKDKKQMEFFDNYIPTYEVENGIVELMQFTGLYDKNGKEIFEGDIIKTDTTGIYPKIVKWTENKQHIGFNIAFNTFHKKEIIGNIYENPNLLIPSKQ